jgi:3-methyladenine DNA glycosylase/8-oxoguanine DNA glycosylase
MSNPANDEQMRKDFESEAGPMGFDLTRQYIAVPEPWAEYRHEATGYFWAGWKAATLAERERQVERGTP